MSAQRTTTLDRALIESEWKESIIKDLDCKQTWEHYAAVQNKKAAKYRTIAATSLVTGSYMAAKAAWDGGRGTSLVSVGLNITGFVFLAKSFISKSRSNRAWVASTNIKY